MPQDIEQETTEGVLPTEPQLMEYTIKAIQEYMR